MFNIEILEYSIRVISLSHAALAIIFSYLGYIYYKNFHYPHHIGPLKSIPGPPNAFLQYIKFMYYRLTGNPAKIFKELHAKYGPICHLGNNVIAINDPEATKQIYGSYKFKKTNRFVYFCENVQNIFSTRDKQYHSIRKRVISPAFSMKSVIELEPLIALHCVGNLTLTIKELLDSGHSQVDFYELFHKSIGDAISDTVLGRCFNSLQKPDFPAFRLGAHIANSWGLKFTLPFLGFLKANHHPIINQNVVQELKERRTGKYRKDILQTLIDAKDTDGNLTFTDEEVIEEASILIFGGMEPTAIGLIWTFYLLLRNPEKYKKLVEEIVTAFPDINGEITYEMCKDLPYLTGVIYESLRVKSPAGITLPRVVPEGGATILGYFLPEGTIIGTSSIGIHFSETNWPDAETFIPERWLVSETNKLKDAFFAFSMGPRSCVGRNLALLEMYITISNLIRKFDFSMPKDTTLTELNLFVLTGKEEKLLLNTVPRSK